MEDPCNYCIDKHGIKDINGINNCCYQQCANLMGTTDIDTIINSPCGRNCKQCMDKAKKATGRDLCYLRRIKPPLIWGLTEGFDYKEYTKFYPFVFYISLAIAMLFVLLVLMILIKVIFGRKK